MDLRHSRHVHRHKYLHHLDSEEEEPAEEAGALALEVEVHLEAEEAHMDQHLEDNQLAHLVHRLQSLHKSTQKDVKQNLLLATEPPTRPGVAG